MKTYVIYKHTSPSGKIYVGQTCKENPKRRWANGKGYKENPHFYKAINKYGWNNFTNEIICSDLVKWEADWVEKYLIAYYNTTNQDYGYNLTSGGEGISGFHHSEETKQKLSEHFKGCTSWNKGIPCKEETKRKLSERNKGLHRVYDENGKYHYEK